MSFKNLINIIKETSTPQKSGPWKYVTLDRLSVSSTTQILVWKDTALRHNDPKIPRPFTVDAEEIEN